MLILRNKIDWHIRILSWHNYIVEATWMRRMHTDLHQACGLIIEFSPFLNHYKGFTVYCESLNVETMYIYFLA